MPPYILTAKAIGAASIKPEASNRAASSTLEAELLADHTTRHWPDRHASPSPEGKLGAEVIVELETAPIGVDHLSRGRDPSCPDVDPIVAKEREIVPDDHVLGAVRGHPAELVVPRRVRAVRAR